MSTHLPRSPRFLLAVTAVLSAAGVVLLVLPHGESAHTVAPAPRPEATASAVLPAPPAHVPEAAQTNAGEASALTQSAAASELPPHGEGPAGDAAVQEALEVSWPRDLPAGDERQLLAAGRDLLRADATGIGRAKWPGVFPGAGRGVAPAFGTGQFRVQAAIARRDGVDGRAVVHLVWAGADRGGTFTDGRITDWYFIRTVSRKGASTWTPQPRI
ncbi:hypothetical protein ACFQ6O_29980 [Streptomyces sp. NPDC056441]|uniref:hypothetical protein n=1 Tax=Streptomyces sp. NPDC056441 TaxID=3345817 RepID=UPI0036B5BA13